MDKLAEGVGPEGRKLFENFLKQVNKLQEGHFRFAPQKLTSGPYKKLVAMGHQATQTYPEICS